MKFTTTTTTETEYDVLVTRAGAIYMPPDTYRPLESLPEREREAVASKLLESLSDEVRARVVGKGSDELKRNLHEIQCLLENREPNEWRAYCPGEIKRRIGLLLTEREATNKAIRDADYDPDEAGAAEVIGHLVERREMFEQRSRHLRKERDTAHAQLREWREAVRNLGSAMRRWLQHPGRTPRRRCAPLVPNKRRPCPLRPPGAHRERAQGYPYHRDAINAAIRGIDRLLSATPDDSGDSASKRWQRLYQETQARLDETDKLYDILERAAKATADDRDRLRKRVEELEAERDAWVARTETFESKARREATDADRMLCKLRRAETAVEAMRKSATAPQPQPDPGTEHLIGGKFQSDKYPTCPRGKVPLSTKDPMAQDLLWEYAQRRRSVDEAFARDLETALRNDGYDQHVQSGSAATPDDTPEAIADACWVRGVPGLAHEEITARIRALVEKAEREGRIAELHAWRGRLSEWHGRYDVTVYQMLARIRELESYTGALR